MLSSTTRRSLFGLSLPFLLAAPVAISANTSTDGLGELLIEHDAAVAEFCSSRDDSEEDAQSERVGKLRDAILDAPIKSRSDAAAKLKMAAASFDQGALASGKDEAAVLQVARWLEAI